MPSVWSTHSDLKSFLSSKVFGKTSGAVSFFFFFSQKIYEKNLIGLSHWIPKSFTVEWINHCKVKESKSFFFLITLVLQVLQNYGSQPIIIELKLWSTKPHWPLCAALKRIGWIKRYSDCKRNTLSTALNVKCTVTGYGCCFGRYCCKGKVKHYCFSCSMRYIWDTILYYTIL